MPIEPMVLERNRNGKAVLWKCSTCGEPFNLGWGDRCNKCIREDEKHREIIAALNTNKPQWVSVKERLPVERGFYLVSLNTDWPVVMESEFWNNTWHRMGGDYGPISCVSHWMPLPPPAR